MQDKMNIFDAFIVATSILELLFVNEELPEIDEDGNIIIVETVENTSNDDNAFMKLI